MRSMNRNAKRQHHSGESRPRRLDYQPLHVYDYSQYAIYDDTENERNWNSLKLLSNEPEKFVEKAVEPGDTLLSISLQFNCPVAEIKRINHIVRDNEIFARRIIKVPVKPGSAVCEKLAQVHSNGGENKNYESASAPAVSLTDRSVKERATTSDSSTKDSPKSVPYFGTLNLKPIDILKSEGPLLSTESLDDIDDDVNDEISSRPLLERGAIEVVSSEGDIFKCSGADWGLSWVQLVFCALLLGCAGPIFYIWYITEHDKPGNATTTSATTVTSIAATTSTELMKLSNQH